MKARILFLLPLFLLVTESNHAQTLFNKTFIEDRPIMLFSSVIKSDSTYKVIGLAADKLPPYYARAMAASISNLGILTKYEIKIDSSNIRFGVFFNSLIETKKNDFAFTGYVTDSLPRVLLAKFNSSIDSFEIYTYYTSNTYAFFGNALLESWDNSFFITGGKIDSFPSNTNIVLLKIDSLGNRVWEKYYDQYAQVYAKSIVHLANGNLMLGCVRNDLNQTHEHANTWLLEVDTGGLVVRQWVDPNDSTYVAEGLLQTQDGGFVYGAQKKNYQSITDVYKIATIVKLDNNFNKQWTFSGGYQGTVTGFTDIEELPDGSFVACGKSNYRSGWIVKLNSTGGLIWSREYVGIPDTGSENYLTDIDVLADGSLIAVGQCQFLGHTPPQVGWFLKLDSNGCEVENCMVGIDDRLQTTEHRKIQVWPNPAHDKFYMNIENTQMQGGILELYDVNGRKMCAIKNNYSQMSVDVSQYSNGIYLWRYSIENQPVQSGKLVKE